VQSHYKEKFSGEELVEFRDASLPEYELGNSGIELREPAVEDDWEDIARKELGYERETSYVFWGVSEIVMKSVARMRLMKT
jgi:hypothetical protein